MRFTSRLPELALAIISLGLSIAVLICAGHTLSIYNNGQSTNAWLLPLWPNHFDTRDLQLLIGTSAVISVLNVVLIISAFISRIPSTIIDITCSGLSTSVALVAIIFTNVVEKNAPRTDTLQSWTCEWTSTMSAGTQDMPSDFSTMCHETRFAFWAVIPIFILQLALVAASTLAPVQRRRQAKQYGGAVEKGHSLDTYQRQGSSDTASRDIKDHASATVSAV